MEEESDGGQKEEILAERGEASVAGSSAQGGSADIGNEEETVTIESIIAKEPKSELGRLTIERMHRTLTSVISRCIDNKGNWATIVPMSLYFLRCTPNRSVHSC